jgi:hypothetical protein
MPSLHGHTRHLHALYRNWLELRRKCVRVRVRVRALGQVDGKNCELCGNGHSCDTHGTSVCRCRALHAMAKLGHPHIICHSDHCTCTQASIDHTGHHPGEQLSSVWRCGCCDPIFGIGDWVVRYGEMQGELAAVTRCGWDPNPSDCAEQHSQVFGPE